MQPKNNLTQKVENFLEKRPCRNREWEQIDREHSAILIPKFGDHFLGRFIKARLRNPNYRVKLDDVGSFVWQQCDGNADVATIGKKLSTQFGEKVEPVYDRLLLFFRSLERNKSIIWQK